jgi:hypothetical protein
MPTKKQRRRQQKSRRHEYEYVYVDDEGNEVEVDPAELRAEKNGKRAEARTRPDAKSRPAVRAGGRVIEPPSWRRAVRRALIFGPVLVVGFMLLNRNGSTAAWLSSAIFFTVFFVPITYVTDSMAYRMYRKRLERHNAAKSR